jgi:uncharacterized membrane protein (DUF4010 family)
LLIAALGFTNYILLKLYGERGIEFTGFLGGLVNSTVTVAELTQRAGAAGGQLTDVTFRGVILATAAMLVRNAIILGLLAPLVLLSAAVPLALMIAGAAVVVLWHRRHLQNVFSNAGPDSNTEANQPAPTLPTLESPFSLTAAFKFGFIFLALRMAGTLAERGLGEAGFYAVSVVGGVVSSASAVASAANLAAAGTLAPHVAGIGAIIASTMSAIINLPLAARLGHDRSLTLRIAWALGAIVVLGVFGCIFETL